MFHYLFFILAMKSGSLFFVLFFATLSPAAFASKANELILQGKAALVLNNTRLYQDSSYLRPTAFNLRENDLVELIQMTTNEFPDNAQNQQFKWNLVRTLQGQSGWVFGDELATYNAIPKVDLKLRPFVHQRKRLYPGFETALIWFASMEGKDIKKGKAFFNPLYKENYIIATNEIGQSLALNYAIVSESGKNEIIQLWMTDLTRDGCSEIILVKSSEVGVERSTTKLTEIFSIQGGNFLKIWEESLEVGTSPDLKKHIFIRGQTIQVSYLDFLPAGLCSLPDRNLTQPNVGDQCLELNTFTLQWDRQNRRFEALYPLSKSKPKGTITVNCSLLSSPDVTAPALGNVQSGEICSVVQYLEREEADQKYWLLVKTSTGRKGYLLLNQIKFEATVVRNYFSRDQSETQQEQVILVID